MRENEGKDSDVTTNATSLDPDEDETKIFRVSKPSSVSCITERIVIEFSSF